MRMGATAVVWQIVSERCTFIMRCTLLSLHLSYLILRFSKWHNRFPSSPCFGNNSSRRFITRVLSKSDPIPASILTKQMVRSGSAEAARARFSCRATLFGFCNQLQRSNDRSSSTSSLSCCIFIAFSSILSGICAIIKARERNLVWIPAAVWAGWAYPIRLIWAAGPVLYHKKQNEQNVSLVKRFKCNKRTCRKCRYQSDTTRQPCHRFLLQPPSCICCLRRKSKPMQSLTMSSWWFASSSHQ